VTPPTSPFVLGLMVCNVRGAFCGGALARRRRHRRHAPRWRDARGFSPSTGEPFARFSSRREPFSHRSEIWSWTQL